MGLPDSKPTVETTSVPIIGINDAAVLSKITSNGSSNVTAYGVCWVEGAISPPTIANSKADGAGIVNGGEYATILDGLRANTRYTVRAYATNAAGTSYGDPKSFLTKEAPTVETVEVRGVGTTSAGVFSKIADIGSSAVTTYGVCWVKGTGTPTTSNSKEAGTNLANGNFSVGITGLDRNSTYTVRAYATNAAGTDYGDKKAFMTLP